MRVGTHVSLELGNLVGCESSRVIRHFLETHVLPACFDEGVCGCIIDAKDTKVQFDISLHPTIFVYKLMDAMIPCHFKQFGSQSSWTFK
jgi:hypothetical protein